MAFKEKAVVYGNNLLIARNNQNDVIVLVWCLTSSDDHNFTSLNEVHWRNSENAKKVVLSFECTEDKYSGIVYPTLFVCFLDSKSNAYKYVTLIMKKEHSFSQTGSSGTYNWKLLAVKQLEMPLMSQDILISSTFILVGYSDVIYSTGGKLFHCDNISEHEIPLDCNLSEGVNSTVIHMFLIQSSRGDRYIGGMISGKFNENIAMETSDSENVNNDDHLDINQILFMKSVIVQDDDTLKFVSIKSSDILPEEFDNINGFHIHSIRAQTLSEKDAEPDLKTHTIIIANDSYLLEFKSKALLHSVCLARAIEQYDSNINFAENDFVIVGFLEREDSNSLVLLQNTSYCFTVNMASQKVEHVWSNVRHVFVCDILSKGRYQVLMIFQEMYSNQELDQWLITDLDKLIIDNREQGQEGNKVSRNQNCHAARTALHKQLEALTISVEKGRKTLEEKADFLEKNLLRLQKQSRFPRHTEKASGNYCMKEAMDGEIEVVEVWHQVVDTQLVVIVHLINKSHRDISKIGLSLLLNTASSKVLRSESKVHPNLTEYYCSNQTNNPLKKMKIDFAKTVHTASVLCPNQGTFITCNCSVDDLAIISSSNPTVSVYIHYRLCAIDDDDKSYPVMQSCKDGDIVLKPGDLNNGPFIERLSKGFSTIDLTVDNVTKDRLSLEAIQEPHKFAIKAKYGCLGRIDNTLSKIPGVTFSYVADCHIILTPGVFYLIRMKSFPSTDFKSASIVVYVRCEEQLNIFLQYLKTFFSDSVTIEAVATNKLSLAKEFVRQAMDEVNQGLHVTTLVHKKLHNRDHASAQLTDSKNREQVTKFQEQLEHDEKTLSCGYETHDAIVATEESDLTANRAALIKLEQKTDELCFKVLS